MVMVRLKLLAISLAAILLTPASGHAALVYTYDFPGTPGSGVASDQTNPQTGNITFGDWSRVNVSGVATTDVFDTNLWNTTAIFDSTQYESFTITAGTGYHLDLSSLTFDQMRTSGGPTKALVQIFVNGSAIVWDSFSYNPSASVQNKSFSFIPTTDPDNVTLMEFRFYGWNGGTLAASLILDNVTISGIGVVPETSTIVPIILLFACVALERSKARRRCVRSL
jgi:hypothetical protein